MIDTSDFRNGLTFEVEGAPYKIIWFQHHKPGKGGAVVRVKLRNIRTGATIERTFRAGEKFPEVEIATRKKQYLYREGDTYYFMDLETYEQIPIHHDFLGDNIQFLRENDVVEVVYLKSEILGVELPATVELKVEYTEPGVRGDTVTNVTKPAKLETGAEVQVPLFIEQGNVVRVDTRTGEYVERVNK